MKKLLKEVELLIAQSAPFTFFKFWKDADFDHLSHGIIKLVNNEKRKLLKKIMLEAKQAKKGNYFEARAKISEAERQALGKQLIQEYNKKVTKVYNDGYQKGLDDALYLIKEIKL